jgi:hypothetical protein
MSLSKLWAVNPSAVRFDSTSSRAAGERSARATTE